MQRAGRMRQDLSRPLTANLSDATHHSRRALWCVLDYAWVDPFPTESDEHVPPDLETPRLKGRRQEVASASRIGGGRQDNGLPRSGVLHYSGAR